MGDLFVALPPCTNLNAVIFGKNSHRPGSEVQDVVYFPAQDYTSGEKVKCTYMELDQVDHTHAVILSKPSWMWGAEMGSNEKGVAVGNVPVWTRLNGPHDLEPKLLGNDIVRISLERASSAREALDIIGSLLVSPGQGGPCTDEAGKEGWCFHNSFLVADCKEAWVLESAGHLWAAQKIESGVRNISNELSISTIMDLTSPNLIDEAKKLGFYSDDKGPFDFRATFCVQVQAVEASGKPSVRFRHGKEQMDAMIEQGKISYQNFFKLLRDEEGGICMMDGGFITSGSQVSVLLPPDSCPSPNVHWFTGTPNPATSIYKPFFFGPGADIGDVTKSVTQGAEADESEIGHPLFRGHKKLIEMMDTNEDKAQMVLSQIRELEKKCAEDVDEIMLNFEESSFPKLKQIFKHMACMEINFYA